MEDRTQPKIEQRLKILEYYEPLEIEIVEKFSIPGKK